MSYIIVRSTASSACIVLNNQQFSSLSDAIEEVKEDARDDSEPFYTYKIVDLSDIDDVVINRRSNDNRDRIVINL